MNDHSCFVFPEIAENDVALILMDRWPDEHHHSEDMEPSSLHEEIFPSHIDMPAVHWHLAQHSYADKNIVGESKTVVHDVNHGIGEDTDIDALEESSQAVQPHKH